MNVPISPRLSVPLVFVKLILEIHLSPFEKIFFGWFVVEIVGCFGDGIDGE